MNLIFNKLQFRERISENNFLAIFSHFFQFHFSTYFTKTVGYIEPEIPPQGPWNVVDNPSKTPTETPTTTPQTPTPTPTPTPTSVGGLNNPIITNDGFFLSSGNNEFIQF